MHHLSTRPLVLGLLVCSLIHAPLASAKWGTDTQTDQMMSAMFDGPPKLSTTTLDPAAYVEESVQKLKNPKLAYVNWPAITEILHNLGYDEIPKRLTPELSRAILDRAGFAKPLAGESPDAYAKELRTLYSIRYGGRWINYNFGSGRNGASGLVDIKGIGKTQLVRPWADGGHSSGGMVLSESIKEVMWSNLLHEELPLGANRVLFVITTGTLSDPTNPESQPRAILVREDPIRPAYFQANDGVKQTLMSDALREMHTAADQKRMERLLPRLLDALPLPKNFKRKNAKPADIIRAGFYELIERVSLQYSKGYTNQILLAGVSTSNVELSGRALDYGATTAMNGYAKMRLVPGEAPFGSPESLKNDLIIELAQDFRELLPADWTASIPSDKDLGERLELRFKQRVNQNFLELAGTPLEYSEAMSATAIGKQMSALLREIVETGNDEIIQWTGEGNKKIGTYDLELILNKYAKGEDLYGAIRNDKLRTAFTKTFSDYQVELGKLAQADNISTANLKTYMQLAIPARNRALDSKIWGVDFPQPLAKAFDQFLKNNKTESIQSYVETTLLKSIREYKAPRFQLIVTDNTSAHRGVSTQSVFNLKTGELKRQTQRLLPTCERMLETQSAGRN